MSSLIPPGYQAVLVGSATTLEDLNAYAPLEEEIAEGSILLMRLDFADFPSGDVLDGLEKALRDKGVRPWPGYYFIVYADTTQPSIYLAWQKGIPWMTIIIGILALTALPMLLGGLVWLILPQSLKDLINNLIGMGMMLLVMFVMMQVMKPLTAGLKEKPKEIGEART